MPRRLSSRKKQEIREALVESFQKEQQSTKRGKIVAAVFVIIAIIAALLLVFNTLI